MAESEEQIAETVNDTDGDATEGEEANSPPEYAEIVLEGDSSTPDEPKPATGLKRRIAKLSERGKVAQAEAERERQRAEMLQARLDQLESQGGTAEPTGPPTLEAFDYDEAKYQAAQAEYIRDSTARTVQQEFERVMGAARSRTEEQQKNERRQTELEAHYERANKLPIKDYEAAEERAIDIIGQQEAENIMRIAPKSEFVLAHFGNNPAAARKYVAMSDENPARAVMWLGELQASFKLKGSEPTPDPDETLEGAGVASPGASDDQLKKLLDKANRTGDASEYLAALRRSRSQ